MTSEISLLDETEEMKAFVILEHWCFAVIPSVLFIAINTSW